MLALFIDCTRVRACTDETAFEAQLPQRYQLRSSANSMSVAYLFVV